MNDFYNDWQIEETCDSVTLESSHPLNLNSDLENQMVYTHECRDDEIVYFKVDVNLIGWWGIPSESLGNV